MATGRVSTGTTARQISAVDTDILAHANITGTEQVGGVGGVTSEPCFGFVHVKATGASTANVDTAVAAISDVEYLPGEVAVA